MMTWLGLALPGGVLLLMAVAAFEMRPNGRKRLKKRLSTTYMDEMTAFLYGTKRRELDNRETMSMLLDGDIAQGAPPRHDIDLDRGVATLKSQHPDPDPPPGPTST
jgi:hypothetical protein